MVVRNKVCGPGRAPVCLKTPILKSEKTEDRRRLGVGGSEKMTVDSLLSEDMLLFL